MEDRSAQARGGSKWGRFELLQFLGKGGFGAVWRVRDPLRRDQDLALKVFDAESGHIRSRGISGSLLQEVRAGATLRHPVLPEIVEVGILAGSEGLQTLERIPETGRDEEPALPTERRSAERPYILTEFFPGAHLKPPWDPGEIADVAADLLSALECIHAAGWRHGDLKPSNVLVLTRAPAGNLAASCSRPGPQGAAHGAPGLVEATAGPTLFPARPPPERSPVSKHDNLPHESARQVAEPSREKTSRPLEAPRHEVRILDFGLAEELRPGAPRARTGGTPAYVAPEVLGGARPDHRADLYALGLLLYECLRGPLEGSIGDHLLRTRQGSFYRGVLEEQIPEPMGTLVRKLLDPDPGCRLQSATDGIALLQERPSRPEPQGAKAPAVPRIVPSFEAPSPIGVDSILESLSEALRAAQARKPRPSVVAISGARGLGKTRLIRECIQQAFSAGLRSLSWEALKARAPGSEGGPLQATGALAAGLARNPSLRDFSAKCGEVSGEDSKGIAGGLQGLAAGEGSSSFAEPRGVAVDGKEARDRKAEQLFDVLLEEPTLLAVDDAHLLAPEDQAILESILERLHARRGRTLHRRVSPRHLVMVIAAAPGPAGGPGIARIRRRLSILPWTTRAALRPFSEREVDLFLDRVLPPRRDLGAFEHVIRRQARGSPARLRLILRELARAGDLSLRKGRWICERPVARGPVPLPGERERFLEELAALEETDRDVLGAASLLSRPGDGAPPDLLAAALSLERWQLEKCIRKLRSSESLGSSRVADIPGLLRIDRPRRAWVLRAAGYRQRKRWREGISRTSPTSRLALHEAVRVGSPTLEAVLAGTAGGGALAERTLAFHAACPRFAPEERAVTALRLGEALVDRSEVRRAIAYLEIALREAADSHVRFRAEIRLGEVALALGDADAAAEHFSAASTIDGSSGDARARGLFAVAVAHHKAGRSEAALDAARKGAADHPDVPAFRSLLGNIALALGRLDEAEKAFLQAISLSDLRGDARGSASARTNYGRLLSRAGRLEEAARMHRLATEGFERSGLRASAALALRNLGTALRRLGDAEGAVAAAERSLTISRELGDDAGIAVAEANLGILARELGLPGTASRRFRAALDAVREARRRPSLAAGALAAGRPAAPRAAAGGLLAEIEGNLLFMESRALLALDLENLDEAIELDRAADAARAGEAGILSPEGLLLKARLWKQEVQAERGGVESTVRKAAGDDRYAIALAECLTLPLPEGTGMAAARGLEELGARSSRARPHWLLSRIESSRDEKAKREAMGQLKGEIHLIVDRDTRRRALVAVLRMDPADGDARGLIARLLDEVAFDLDPDGRRRFEGRADIKEARELSRAHESVDAAAARSAVLLREVFRLNREILDEVDLEKILRKIVDAAVSLTGAERGVLALRREGRMPLVAARSGGRDLPDPESEISRTVLERTMVQGTPTITTDAREDLTLKSIASVEELGLRSVICVPLQRKARVFGALYLDNPFERGVFTPRDMEVLESFCGQAVLAWLTARRRRQVQQLLDRLREANRKLEGELHLSRRDARRRSHIREKTYGGIVGDSGAMRKVFELIEAVAPTEIPILITGESGTGKELVARAIAAGSRRAGRPFVAENCGALPEGLLESTLFGHEKGAFTGADRARQGLFEMASGGTLFLDEIAEMPLPLQARLLRVLQEGEVRPLGSRRVLKLDVRVIAATNHDVREEVARGKFREDLFFRLQGAEIHVLPLRERPEDIPLLVEHFLERMAGKDSKPRRVSPETMERLARYSWPGNARELENEVRRLCVRCPTEVIGPEFLSPQVREGIAPRLRPAGAETREVLPLLDVEREAILHALRVFDGHRGKAAKALGVSRSTLYLKLRDMGYVDGPP